MSIYMKLYIGVNGIIILIILFFSINSADASVKENHKLNSKFHEFYEQQLLHLDYTVSTARNRKVTASTVVSGDDLYLSVSADEKDDFVESLTSTFGIERTVSEKIVNDLTKGVSSSQSCFGFRSDCGLLPELYDFVYIPEQLKVVIFVNSRYLNDIKISDEQYIKREISQEALISSHTLNLALLDRSSSYDSKMSYQNRSYLGISDHGYLYSDFMVNSDGDYSVADLSFNRVYENNRISLGYKYTDSAWNDSSYLGDFGISGFMLQLGSDHAMLKDSGIDRRIYFNVSRGGRLEVVDDLGRYLVSKNVEIGQHYISYSDLPKGNYSITIRVYDGETDIYSERVTVYNHNSSRVGGINYMLTGGYYNPNWVANNRTSNKYYDVNDYDSPFLDGRLSYNWTDSLTVGSGSLVADSDYILYAGIDLDFERMFRTSFVLYSYNSDDSAYRLNIYSSNVSLSYYRYDVSSSESLPFYRMINLNIGERESIAFNANYNFSKPVSYVGTITHSRFSSSLPNYDYAYDNTSLKNSLYFNDLPLRSRLGIQCDTTFETSKKVQHGIFVNLSIPLDGNAHVYTHSVSGSLNGNSTTRHQDSLSSNLLSTNGANISSRLGASYDEKSSENNIYDLSFSASYNDNYQNVNGYSYMNSTGSNSISVQYNTNSIVTKDSAFLTDKRSSTYFVNRNASEFNDKNSFLAVVDSKKNGSRDRSYTVSSGTRAYPLNEYKEYEFFLDTEASDFYNVGDNHAFASSFPGTVIGMQTGLGEVKSFISTFSDINGSPISDVECVGLGCVSVVDISEGVYQIRLKPEYAYKIISRKNQCVIPSLDKAENLNLGNNFCMPPFVEGDDGLLISQSEGGINYYYLGRFDINSHILSSYIKEFKEKQGVELIVKSVDDYNFVFIKSSNNLSDVDKKGIDELISYALTDESVPYAAIGN